MPCPHARKVVIGVPILAVARGPGAITFTGDAHRHSWLQELSGIPNRAHALSEGGNDLY